ncbi:hypothetical protein [Pseudalkalibacillus hwajinpoensis]|uniref:Uncharacterized protein n=1 Tax=Guptibacillus hwajinpoensis TaxID=208199 RepID=A0A4U1MHR5_9BACL|nr:hypothetical protein [Pseudalkalibacillus hwajinpoensis]TKD69982.1 hypothetical protein FBF83_12005 [Pseudalkalibacillus hwajinpoensis]
MIWVMTQNKKSLLYVKEISVKGRYIEGVVERRFFIEWKKTLGTYGTTERALEVLEELFKNIDGLNEKVTNVYMPLK